MPYQSTEKTRQKKDAKRTRMMQSSVKIFAEKGYQAATVRDIVADSGVAIGTFYFYFPDKETLFVSLYEETAEFVLQTIRQGINSRATLPQQISAGIQAYFNLGVYEPAIIHLLLVGGVGALPSLVALHETFREQMVQAWQRPLLDGIDSAQIVEQNTRRSAEALSGACDEVLLNLLAQPDTQTEAPGAVRDMLALALRMVGYVGAAA